MRRSGLRAALLALAIYLIAPVVHAIVHPDHVLSDPWDIADSEHADQTADHGKPGAPRSDAHHCLVCQTLGALAAAVPASIALAVLTVATAFVPEIPAVAWVVPRRHLRPPGRAPPELS